MERKNILFYYETSQRYLTPPQLLSTKITAFRSSTIGPQETRDEVDDRKFLIILLVDSYQKQSLKVPSNQRLNPPNKKVPVLMVPFVYSHHSRVKSDTVLTSIRLIADQQKNLPKCAESTPKSSK